MIRYNQHDFGTNLPPAAKCVHLMMSFKHCMQSGQFVARFSKNKFFTCLKHLYLQTKSQIELYIYRNCNSLYESLYELVESGVCQFTFAVFIINQ